MKCCSLFGPPTRNNATAGSLVNETIRELVDDYMGALNITGYWELYSRLILSLQHARELCPVNNTELVVIWKLGNSRPAQKKKQVKKMSSKMRVYSSRH